jgi:hypothetical protein
MPRSRKLLALVRSRADQQAPLERVTAAAGYELELTETIPLAAASLRKAPPTALLVEATARGAEELCQKARLGRVPGDLCLLVAARKLNDVAFAKAFHWGADDLVNCEAERGLIQRLARLPQDPTGQPQPRGVAVVADPHPLQAARLGRLLSHAGYAVEIANEVDPALQLIFSDAAALVVATADFGLPAELVALAREAGSRACFVWVLAPADLAVHERPLRAFERTGVVSSAEPLEAALFVSNEIMGRERQHGRTESRLLYGTVAAFRAAGSDEDEFGFTYNISPHGMYVRTLAPPDEDQVWLELRPPSDRRRVRLAGTIAWRCGFGRLGTATAPPGFGVRISAGLCSDHPTWIEGYDSLLAEVAAAAKFQPAPNGTSPAPVVSSCPPPEAGVALEPTSLPPVATHSAAILPAPESLAEPRTDSELSSEGVAPVQPPASIGPEDLEPGPPASPPRPRSDRPSGKAKRAPVPTPRAPTSRRAVAPKAVLGLVIGAAAVLGIAYLGGWLGRRDPEPAAPAAGPPRATPAQATNTAESLPPSRSSAKPEVIPSGALLSATPSPGAAPTEAPSSAPLPSADGSGLPFTRGYLWVASDTTATVFVNGIATGSTNSLLEVPCGLRFVRLGSTPGPRWLSPGHTVDVVCRSFNRVTIQP